MSVTAAEALAWGRDFEAALAGAAQDERSAPGPTPTLGEIVNSSSNIRSGEAARVAPGNSCEQCGTEIPPSRGSKPRRKCDPCRRFTLHVNAAGRALDEIEAAGYAPGYARGKGGRFVKSVPAEYTQERTEPRKREAAPVATPDAEPRAATAGTIATATASVEERSAPSRGLCRGASEVPDGGCGKEGLRTGAASLVPPAGLLKS